MCFNNYFNKEKHDVLHSLTDSSMDIYLAVFQASNAMLRLLTSQLCEQFITLLSLVIRSIVSSVTSIELLPSF